ncbi:coiled-coil domain-containing protein 157 isoform X7 [Patagioenas fasciata]|uniref:coiled-coil domain-containing protein 157 isoform X7 n=1 Tax=Patagioenas fasciata TaxID=372321 RepID=UPI003A99E84C
MAQLLGHPGCMESLRADLRDLQAAIGDVWARAGPVRFPSWKFPDRVSCELDVPALLERYSHRHGDPQFSQHAHVALLELLIDRLLLLLQSFTGYAENLLSERDEPPGQAVGPGMSAGLTARRYWCSMLKLGAFCQQLLAEKKAGKEELPALQPTPQAGNAEKKHPKHSLPDVLEIRTSPEVPKSTSPCPSSSVRGSDSVTPGSSVPRAAGSAAASSHSVPTQTAGSAPGACDTCASAQASLRQVGKAITSVCQSQNIPSALSRFQEMVEDPTGPSRTLSATDLSYWAVEQSKDLARISKHLQTLLQQVNPLKSELQESQKQKDELRKKVEDFSRLLQAEKETQAQQRRKAEQSLKVKNKEHLEAVARLERDKDDLRRGSGSVTEDMEKQLEANSIRIGVLEQENARLRSALAKVQVAAAQGVLKLIPQTHLCSQLGSQRCGEDAGPPSSRGSEDSAGPRGCAGERQQRAPSSQRSQPRSAGPCRSLPAAGLLLSPPEPRGRGTAAPRPSRRK